MLERQKKIFIVSCDGNDCVESEDLGTYVFSQARENLRESGWTTIKSPSGEWEHFCPGCTRSRRA